MSSSPRSIRGFTMSKLGVVIPPMSRPPSSRPGDYEVEVELVAVVDPVRVHDDRGQSDVDAVPVEDAGERLREDRPRPRDFDDQGRMLPGRALPEVPPADDEVPL